MGFGISHQKAGLNWAGRYKERVRIQNAKWKMQHEQHPSPGTRAARRMIGDWGLNGTTHAPFTSRSHTPQTPPAPAT